MDNKMQKLWETRKREFPSNIKMEELTETEREYAEQLEEKEFEFLMEHTPHGEIVLKHIAISESPVELSKKFRTWQFLEPRYEFSGMKKWEFHLVCAGCHKSLTIVDQNTPAALKAI